MNKKAMSAIIAVMILILIVLAGTGIIWKVLTKTVDEGLEEAKSCYDILGKVGVNSKYTCYDSVEDEMMVSVSIEDIELEGLFIVIAFEDSAVSFELTNEFKTIENLRNYNGTFQIKVPGENQGTTYIASNIVETPFSIEIVPKINGNLCAGEKFTAIGRCSGAEPGPPEETCTDSDGGIVYDVKGTAIKGEASETDARLDETDLREVYCNLNEIATDDYTCPDFCHINNDVCGECTETDAGYDPYTPGQMFDHQSGYFDQCDGDTLYEWICNPNVESPVIPYNEILQFHSGGYYAVIDCPNSCVLDGSGFGACVKPTCIDHDNGFYPDIPSYLETSVIPIIQDICTGDVLTERTCDEVSDPGSWVILSQIPHNGVDDEWGYAVKVDCPGSCVLDGNGYGSCVP